LSIIVSTLLSVRLSLKYLFKKGNVAILILRLKVNREKLSQTEYFIYHLRMECFQTKTSKLILIDPIRKIISQFIPSNYNVNIINHIPKLVN
jgi:hypothetical protein